MNAEIITTGTEILLGEIVDTNATWIARRLRDLGINLYYKTTVGDNLERIVAAMRQSLERSELVLVTGGLGPTVDDITRDAAAKATNRDLILNQESLAKIEALFARWGRSVLDNNRRQAFMPEGAVPINNPVGTAPGFLVEVPREGRPAAVLICLPGVPREMKHLMEETIEPLLAQRLGDGRVVIKARTLRTVGIGESSIDERIGDLMLRDNPTVGLAAHMGQADIRITARATTGERAEAMIDEVAEQIRARLGQVIYGEGTVPLEAVVVKALRSSGLVLALLETNTGGDVAQRLKSVAGGDQVLCWSRSVGTLSDVSQNGQVEEFSEAAARAAAAGLQSQLGPFDDPCLVLVIAGMLDHAAGPYGAYRGETYLALAARDEVASHRLGVGGVEELARRWIGNGALNWLRLWLASQSGKG
jgi:nicotinamide-nucleotide amidase